ncbi:hypothetical protein SSX86_025942 [Deinandra increscens subsp. villosa]|uniref:Late embryogenesis abundant protein LEA-2 subgroup domain-containing protein n=1 Tax=Deinandra increscens subsp. villosa TaxID=3103831 RepID=A0AAP0CK77_9ASTR
MEVEKKDVPRVTTTVAGDRNRHRKRKRRRCICLSVIAVVLLLALIILILALTVFKAKRPITTVNSVAIKDLDASVSLLPPRVSLNVSLDLDITIRNPNKVRVKFRNSSAILLYKGEVIGDVPIPAGEIGSDGTKQLNLTLTVFADRLLTNTDVYADFIRGNLPVSTSTRISGKARVLNLFNIRIVSISSCDLDISISDRRIANQTCHYSNKN